jgi:hypothetical protein
MEARVRELLNELDRLIPADRAQVILFDSGDDVGKFPFCATPEGFLLFGLAFMRAAYAPAAGRGANGGEKVAVDLDAVYRSDSNVEFLCERVSALPEEGDRRRSREIPGLVGWPILLFVLWCLILGIGQAYRIVSAFFLSQ